MSNSFVNSCSSKAPDMFWTPTALKFYFYRQPTDMRKSFDGLCGLITTLPAHDPLNGSVYIFINKRKNRIKLLLWDGDGFWIFYKRLEKGTFQVSFDTTEKEALVWSYDQLLLVLSGIDLTSVKRRERYKRQIPQ
jgi:transposase